MTYQLPGSAPEDEKAELDFLRYFYKHAAYQMGPADGDIYESIGRYFEEDGGTIPEPYREWLGLDWEEANGDEA